MKITDISFSFDDKIIFDNLNLEIQDGKITALMAPSGKGKTTLLRLIAGLLPPSSGSIDTNGRSVGIMFQEPRLFAQITNIENVMLVMKNKQAKQQKATELLEAFGVYDAANKYPGELSGGMAKRVSLARAIAFNADILLLDEPFSALDKETKVSIIEKTKELLRGKTVLFVTHDETEAALFAETIIQLP